MEAVFVRTRLPDLLGNHTKMFATTTAITSVEYLITNLGLVIAGVITAILGLYVALLGLGWGVRKFKAYISGRKF